MKTSEEALLNMEFGLAISHRIIDHHYGSISCASKTRGSKRGTTFTIRLPITPPPNREQDFPLVYG